MAKRKRGFNNKKYQKWIDEGRGQGQGINYKPWLTIQDVSGKGKSTRIHGNLTDRQHDLLSKNELNYFYILSFADNVIDIREQFPLLPIEETERIAEEIGVEHPTDPSTGEHTVLTTDFLINVVNNGKETLLARTIKELDDLNNERQIEKFEIERRYWEKLSNDINWGIVTEQNINETLAKNISIIYPFYDLNGIKGFENLSELQILRLIKEFYKCIIGDDIIIRDIADSFDDKMMLESGTSIKLFKHLLMKKQIIINMLEPINLDKPVTIFPKNNELRREISG